MNYNTNIIMNGITNTDYPPQQKHQHQQQQQQQKCIDVQSNPSMSRLVPFVISFVGANATATTATNAKGNNNEIITTIHPHDVLFCAGGQRKGSSSNNNNAYREHEGNIFLRTAISKKQKNYFQWSIKERERDKSNLMKSVIDEVKGRNPPGRFLKEVAAASGSSWILLDKKDYLAKIGHALFDKVDRFELKQKNKMMIKNYLLSAAARVQAEESRMQSISIQQQRLQQQQQQQRKVAPQLSQSQPNNKRYTIQDINYQADHQLRLAQMQRRKVEMERQKQQEQQQQQQEMIKHRKAFEVQELHTRSQQLHELIQREQQRQFLQLHQQEMQRKIELERQEQEQQNEQRHQDALEEQERHTRCEKLLLLRNPLKLEHQRQLELIHEEQQRQLKQHVQLQLERKLQQQLTQLRQHQQAQFPHSATEDVQSTLPFITRSRSNTETTLPQPQPQEVGSNSTSYMSPKHSLYGNNKTIFDDVLTNRKAYMINKQRTLESLLFAAAVPNNNNNNDYNGNLVSAPNSFININNANESKTSNYATASAAAAAAGVSVSVSDNINHPMIPFSTVAPPKHPTANKRYESKNYGGYGSSSDDSKTSLVF